MSFEEHKISHFMKKFVHCALFLVTLCNSLSAFGNATESPALLMPRKKIHISDSLIVADKMHADTTFVFRRGANGLIEIPPRQWTPFPDNVSFRDTVIYNPAYLPVIFDGKILPSKMDFIKRTESKATQLHLIPEENTLAPMIEKVENIQKLRRDFYTNMNNIESVKYNAFTLKKLPKINTEEVTKHNILHDLITAEDAISVEPVELTKIAPKFIYWTYNGEHQLQVAQNYISENWYKGGEQSFFIVNNHKLYLNYKKEKFSFQNSFEWKLKVIGLPADSVNDFSIGEDLVKLINTFGYQAFNKWEYTAKLETQTQLFKNKVRKKTKDEDDKIVTNFLSPVMMNFGIGMKYSTVKQFDSDKYKKIEFSVNLAPFSVNYIFIKDNNITNRQNVEPDKHFKIEFGSLINSDLKYSFNRFSSWTSRVRYFTNYQRAEVEFENKFNMQLNRFISVMASAYWRFDDSGNKGNWGYFQRNETLSFGLSYSW